MERLLHYLDDLDDLFYAIPLAWEKARTLARLTLAIIVTVAVQALGIYAALTSPPLAVATASLLIVTLLYRGAVGRMPQAGRAV